MYHSTSTNEILRELDLVERQIEDLVDRQTKEVTLSRLHDQGHDKLEDEFNKEYNRLISKRLALYRELYNR